eukprot:gene55-240_t
MLSASSRAHRDRSTPGGRGPAGVRGGGSPPERRSTAADGASRLCHRERATGSEAATGSLLNGEAATGSARDRRFLMEYCENDASAPDDCTSLACLDEATILGNLQRRYERNRIYTYTSNMLLAVNPYGDHVAPLYSTMVMVISGVSGAGKTETAKIVMTYLAHRSRSREADALEIQDKLRSLNPILESFGNAATVRNCNSSRFGKYNALNFNAVGNLVSAEVRTFLLESSRVTSYGKDERTYHVFYEFLAGATDEDLARRNLSRTESYRLARKEAVNKTSRDNSVQRNDKVNFDTLMAGFATIGIDREQVFDIICGLIHLAEVDFKLEEESDFVKVLENDHMEQGVRVL